MRMRDPPARAGPRPATRGSAEAIRSEAARRQTGMDPGRRGGARRVGSAWPAECSRVGAGVGPSDRRGHGREPEPGRHRNRTGSGWPLPAEAPGAVHWDLVRPGGGGRPRDRRGRCRMGEPKDAEKPAGPGDGGREPPGFTSGLVGAIDPARPPPPPAPGVRPVPSLVIPPSPDPVPVPVPVPGPGPGPGPVPVPAPVPVPVPGSASPPATDRSWPGPPGGRRCAVRA